MLSKIKAVSLVTVEVGDPRLVWRSSGAGDPGSFPLVALPSLRSCHLFLWKRQLTVTPTLQTEEGERGREDGTGFSFEGKDPAVTHLIYTHFPLTGIQSHDHISLQGSWEMHSYIWAGIWPDKTVLIVE